MSLDINQVHCGDCTAILHQHVASESIDMVLTSPPYDNLRAYKGYSFNFEAVADELLRVVKPGGVVVWIVADAVQNGSETGTSFKQALFFKEIGFNLHDTMIYHKVNYVPLTHRRDVVLDPFFGSGTTGVACQQLGRNFLGLEISPEYCEIARKRLKT
jgi:site-specific DNA-methyltransferase (adenine-specific)